MIQLGNYKQKANKVLVVFVFACAVFITMLLYVKVRAEQKAQALSYSGDFSGYMND